MRLRIQPCICISLYLNIFIAPAAQSVHQLGCNHVLFPDPARPLDGRTVLLPPRILEQAHRRRPSQVRGMQTVNRYRIYLLDVYVRLYNIVVTTSGSNMRNCGIPRHSLHFSFCLSFSFFLTYVTVISSCLGPKLRQRDVFV